MNIVTIICPTYNEEKYISICIESIISQDYPLSGLEILFIDGGSTDKTREIISGYQKKHNFIRLINNPHKIVSYAMNIGIENAIGDIIIRIDAHSAFPKNYISILISNLVRLGADNVGGVWKTDVLNKTPKTLAIKEILSCSFGVGNSLFRIGTHNIVEADTVPFGCFKKGIFDKYGLYDTRLDRNQDIEFNKRIKRGGGKILLIPDTFCTYWARETFMDMMNNNYQNGVWNILTVYYTKTFRSLSFRHFVPMLFILSLIVPVLFSLIFPPLILISLCSFLSYTLLTLYQSTKISISKKVNLFYLMIGFPALHLSYGWGSIIGLFKIPFLKR